MFSNTCNILVKNTIFIEKLNDRKKYTHFSNLKTYVWYKHDINHSIQLDPMFNVASSSSWKRQNDQKKYCKLWHWNYMLQLSWFKSLISNKFCLEKKINAKRGREEKTWSEYLQMNGWTGNQTRNPCNISQVLHHLAIRGPYGLSDHIRPVIELLQLILLHLIYVLPFT